MLIYFFMLHPEYLVKEEEEEEEEKVAVPFLPPSFQTNQKSKTFCFVLLASEQSAAEVL